MSKNFFVFVFYVVSALGLSNQDILQQAFNGIFSQNWLPHPTTVMSCIDEASGKKIVNFTGTSLQKLATGSTTDIFNTIN